MTLLRSVGPLLIVQFHSGNGINPNPDLFRIKIKITIKIRNRKSAPGKTQIKFDSGMILREL
jgi:hypothetical protein